MSWFSRIWEKTTGEQNTGLCLSGGGARGVLHIGLIKALEEQKIPFHAISGTSMGAIVALMAASGMSADDMLDAFIELDINSRTKKLKLLTSVFQNGLTGVYDRLKSVTGVEDFDDLKIPCFLTSSELISGRPVIIKSGDPVHAALASASIPLIFHPYHYAGKVYVDGGLFNNFPIDPLVHSCSHIIGSHANHMAEEQDLDGVMKVADRVFRLAIYQNVRYRIELCDIHIDPPEARKYSTLGFDPGELRELFTIGYESGMAAIDKEVLEKKSTRRERREKFTDVIRIEETQFTTG